MKDKLCSRDNSMSQQTAKTGLTEILRIFSFILNISDSNVLSQLFIT